MLPGIAATLIGLLLVVWSADRFVEGAAGLARHFGLPPLLIGMVIVGFGTSAPELSVSVLAAWQGNPGLALGNAYGSNIANIALILGLTALVSPIVVHSRVVRQELPILLAVSLLAMVQLLDAEVSRADAALLLLLFAALMGWSIRQGLGSGSDALARETKAELQARRLSSGRAWFWAAVGLLLLVASSRLLVWGAVEIARGFGVSDLVIGLTIVAVGTSLPELASSLVATRKGESDIALGNVIGSNLFNTLAVVGLAALIEPVAVGPAVVSRDALAMIVLTALLMAYCRRPGRAGEIGREAGAIFVAAYLVYLGFLLATA